ncbi:MAG: hypothetical protein V7K68_19715 [Nostoc sp.]|uniref:hypothetical protein n=1 Tax=Nostoc sp. TaxID=1180 RepID=UPI002FFA9224
MGTGDWGLGTGEEAREQGAGSREQGAGSRKQGRKVFPSARAAPRPSASFQCPMPNAQ